jgi:hypothetical protein
LAAVCLDPSGMRKPSRSSLSYRLFTTGRELGALILFSRQVDAFRIDDVLEGLAIAAHAAVALSGANRLDAMAEGSRRAR